METSVSSARQSEGIAGPVRILIVEDERLVAMSLRKQLHALGYEVVQSVSSGEAAIKAAVESQPDLILMDIRLEGGLDGIEAATEIRKRRDLPIIYLTAFSNSDILARAKITEPFGYILKPFDERELHVVIETALFKHRMEAERAAMQEQERRGSAIVWPRWRRSRPESRMRSIIPSAPFCWRPKWAWPRKRTSRRPYRASWSTRNAAATSSAMCCALPAATRLSARRPN